MPITVQPAETPIVAVSGEGHQEDEVVVQAEVIIKRDRKKTASINPYEDDEFEKE